MSSSAEMKTQIMNQVQQETAINNARTLLAKITENCFEKCTPSPPGSSLSSRDESCMNMCIQKYMGVWNAASRAYVGRLGQESQKAGVGADLGAIGGGNESGNGGMF